MPSPKAGVGDKAAAARAGFALPCFTNVSLLSERLCSSFASPGQPHLMLLQSASIPLAPTSHSVPSPLGTHSPCSLGRGLCSSSQESCRLRDSMTGPCHTANENSPQLFPRVNPGSSSPCSHRSLSAPKNTPPYPAFQGIPGINSTLFSHNSVRLSAYCQE